MADVENNNVEKDTVEIPGAGKEEIENSKEKDLLDIVFALENEKQTIIDHSKAKIFQLRKDLEDTNLENEKLKKRVSQLEQTLTQSAMLSGGAQPKSKQDQEELLTRAKTLLFEKTKTCQQQEQHIRTLKNQVDSIKDVLGVTKEMLNLRNTELEHLEARLQTSNLRAKAEKDKCVIFEKKLAISQGVYDKLRAEYDIQKKIFTNLKETYDLKIKALNTALEAAKK